MKTMSVFVLAAALGAVVAPAFAAHQTDAAQSKVTYNAKTGRYCFTDTLTGSRVPVQDCRTKDQWAKEGVVINDAAAQKLASK